MSIRAEDSVQGIEAETDTVEKTKNDVERIIAEDISKSELDRAMEKLYGIQGDQLNLPQLKDLDGNALDEVVTEWLMLENEDFDSYFREIREHEYQRYAIQHIKAKPGYDNKTNEVLQKIDATSLQDALLEIAQRYLGRRINRQNLLAFPLCRFADGGTFKKISVAACRLTMAPCFLNDTLEAAIYAEKRGWLNKYAEVWKTSARTIRVMIHSNVGLDKDGCKKYDLGNQVVRVRLQSNYGFLVELPDGSTMDELPKDGSRKKLYNIANRDFAKLKDDCSKALESCHDYLFESFLWGDLSSAKSWEKSYLHNPLLRDYLSRIIWDQKGRTFLLSNGMPIDSYGNPYAVTCDDIKVAHPMEMEKDDVLRWKKYLSTNGIRQPFTQIWEPVIDLKDIDPDRYKFASVKFSCLMDLDKDGISVELGPFELDEDSFYSFYFEDVNITIDCNSGHYEYLPYKDSDEYRKFYVVTENDIADINDVHISKPSRMANHVIATLDKIAVNSWIMDDDDISITDFLPAFTRPQILEFVKTAQDANSTNVLAILLDYLDKAKDDYDLMGESELE